MKTLITGHCGYIGSHLEERLRSDAYVYGCDAKNGTYYHGIKGKSFDLVIHLAASVSVQESFTRPEHYFANNAYGIAKFLANNSVKRFIFTSTGGAMYGNSHLAKEEDAAFSKCLSPYAQSKYIAECIISSMCDSYAILRLGNVFGGDHSIRGEASVHAHFQNDNPIMVFGGSQTRDFIHIDDVVDALIAASLSNTSGTFNIGSGEATSIQSLAEHYGSKRGVPVLYQPPKHGEVDYISLDSSKAHSVFSLPPQRKSCKPLEVKAKQGEAGTNSAKVLTC